MLSRDCDGCYKLRECGKRFHRTQKGDKVYCPDGTAHLIDSSSVYHNQAVVSFKETFQKAANES